MSDSRSKGYEREEERKENRAGINGVSSPLTTYADFYIKLSKGQKVIVVTPENVEITIKDKRYGKRQDTN